MHGLGDMEQADTQSDLLKCKITRVGLCFGVRMPLEC